MRLKNVNNFRFLDLVARVIFWCAFALMLFTLAAFFLGAVVPTIYSRITAYGFLILFFVAVGIQVWSSRVFWEKHQLSNERVLAVRLVDAYDRFLDQDSKAGDIARRVSRILQAADEPTKWRTLDRERENLSKIGRDIEVRLVPAMTDKEHAKDIGEILVRLACLFFESSSESIRRAPEVYKDLRVHEPLVAAAKLAPIPRPVTISKPQGALAVLARSTLRSFVIPAAIMLTVCVLVFGVIAALKNEPLSNFYVYIGSAFAVSYLALIGRRLERGLT